MKVSLVTFVHSTNGLSLFVLPETESERELLRGFWKHGRMEKCNGVADGTGEGFCVSWDLKGKGEGKA